MPRQRTMAWRLGSLVITAALLLCATLVVGRPSAAGAASEGTDWRGYLNRLRAAAHLPTVVEDGDRSAALRLHAAYMVQNDALVSDEDPANPGWTEQGDAAAQTAIVAGWSNVPTPPSTAIDLWMGSAFHAVRIVDPDLASVAFGHVTEEGSPGLRVGAALDVDAGVAEGEAVVVSPVTWPGNGSSSPYLRSTGLSPRAAASCPGFDGTTGPPLLAYFGVPVAVSAAALVDETSSTPLETCTFDASSYTSSSGSEQALGRGILASRHAAVMVPRAALVQGHRYRFSITSGGVTARSVFVAGPLAGQLFSDVTVAHPFYDDVMWLVGAGITSGYADGTFRPAATLTRQATAAFLHRIAGAPEGPFPDPGFSDVPPSHPFFLPISWLVASGTGSGYADGTFRPLATLSRQATAAFLHRLAGAPEGPFPDPGFSDVPPSHKFATPIWWMVAAGVGSGYEDGSFRPTADITRQAMARFLRRFDALG